MDISLAIEIGRDLLLTSLLLMAPPVLTSLFVGLIISVIQTLTSIQEQTLTFAPRIIAVTAVMLFTLPWSLRVSVAFGERMILYLAECSR
jgi:flagellar biosynthetic protein FliQ